MEEWRGGGEAKEEEEVLFVLDDVGGGVGCVTVSWFHDSCHRLAMVASLSPARVYFSST